LSNPKFRVFLESKVRASFIILGFDFDLASRSSPLVSLCRIFLSEEVWDVSRVGLGFYPKFRFYLESKVRASSLFWGLDFDAGSSVVPLVVLSNILSEEVWDVSRVGLGFLTQNLGFCLEKVRCALSFIILGLILTVALRSSSLLVSLCRIFCLRRFGT
jgi:hypothetical protein